MREIRNNWTLEEIKKIYQTPLLNLIFKAALMHRKYHDPEEVQVSSLVSIKTGGCPENCSYCSQSVYHDSKVKVERLMSVEEVTQKAKNAKEKGVSRLCLGAAWREVRNNKDFDSILDMIRTVNSMEMEVCCTLGMITEEQAKKMEEAGLYAYNHNIDSSESFYSDIITTRKYEDRLNTIENVRKTNVTLCSGGIIGMGESEEDRAIMLKTLANMDKHPESIPINLLVPVEGTPLETQKEVSFDQLARMIATARIIFPKSFVRLSAGRTNLSCAEQALCFMAGANSIFLGEKLLTTPNPNIDDDLKMLTTLGLKPKKAFA